MHKQVWEITPQDLEMHPVWYFPMIEEGEYDEATVMPANEEIAADQNNQFIVIADFIDSSGNKYLGYVYLGKSDIEYSQPCMFLPNDVVTFWFGIVKPEKNSLAELSFPIKAMSHSVYGLGQLEVTIEHYGYYDEHFEKQAISS